MQTTTVAHTLSSGFAPISRPDARLLILGSLPGDASIRQQQYYAHPQNKFWHIMQALFGVALQAPYAMRCQQVQAAGIAIWDVCHAAQRKGSLDSAITPGTVIANDIQQLLSDCPEIDLIAFNGQAAAGLFRQHVRLVQQIPTLLLPSTSPAHASVRFEDKLERWRVLQARLSAPASRAHDYGSSR